MAKLITVRKAKEEVKWLQNYIDIAESYEANTIEKLIIKECAFTNSVAEIIRIFERRGIMKDGNPIEKEDVLTVINGKVTDDLHRLVKSGYLYKTKHSRLRKSQNERFRF